MKLRCRSQHDHEGSARHSRCPFAAHEQSKHHEKLLAEREVRESAREDYRWSYAGERRLKGIREPVALFRARRLAQ